MGRKMGEKLLWNFCSILIFGNNAGELIFIASKQKNKQIQKQANQRTAKTKTKKKTS